MNVYEESLAFFRSKLTPPGASVLAAPLFASTNDLAKQEAFSLSDPLKIYLCDQQSQGRGRGSNTWSNSASGSSLLLSFSFHVPQAPQPICAPLVGLAVYRALTKTFADSTDHAFSLKAPNDVLLEGKKVAGILVEVVQMGELFRLIVGMGLNVNACPQDVEAAGCLADFLKVNRSNWQNFLSELTRGIQLAAQGAMATHLNETERAELLAALNQNPNLAENYSHISPFGDLTCGQKVVTWRHL